jgi:hypothetical protein
LGTRSTPSVAFQDPGGPRERQGPVAGRGQDELHQSVAVAARLRDNAVRDQVHGEQEGGAAGGGAQPHHEDGPDDRRPPEDVAVQHDEGVERELGGEAHDDPVRGGQHHVQLFVGGLQSGPRVHRRVHFLVDEVEGRESDFERRALPQTDRRLVVSASTVERRRLGALLPTRSWIVANKNVVSVFVSNEISLIPKSLVEPSL